MFRSLASTSRVQLTHAARVAPQVARVPLTRSYHAKVSERALNFSTTFPPRSFLTNTSFPARAIGHRPLRAPTKRKLSIPPSHSDFKSLLGLCWALEMRSPSLAQDVPRSGPQRNAFVLTVDDGLQVGSLDKNDITVGSGLVGAPACGDG
jgi:hypothetical protein